MSKGHHGSGKGGGRSAAEMRAEHQAMMDAQPCVTRCMCGWSYEGTVAEGRELAKGHRRVHHPDIVPRKRRRNNITRFIAQDDGFRSEAMQKAAEVAAMVTREEAAA
jgi:hypothetical protein